MLFLSAGKVEKLFVFATKGTHTKQGVNAH
jgi:hypothetical protein